MKHRTFPLHPISKHLRQYRHRGECCGALCELTPTRILLSNAMRCATHQNGLRQPKAVKAIASPVSVNWIYFSVDQGMSRCWTVLQKPKIYSVSIHGWGMRRQGSATIQGFSFLSPQSLSRNALHKKNNPVPILAPELSPLSCFSTLQQSGTRVKQKDLLWRWSM